jgi:hypothetical protein
MEKMSYMAHPRGHSPRAHRNKVGSRLAVSLAQQVEQPRAALGHVLGDAIGAAIRDGAAEGLATGSRLRCGVDALHSLVSLISRHGKKSCPVSASQGAMSRSRLALIGTCNAR